MQVFGVAIGCVIVIAILYDIVEQTSDDTVSSKIILYRFLMERFFKSVPLVFFRSIETKCISDLSGGKIHILSS